MPQQAMSSRREVLIGAGNGAEDRRLIGEVVGGGEGKESGAPAGGRRGGQLRPCGLSPVS